MRRKGLEGDCFIRGKQLVTTAALGAALVSGVLGNAGIALAAQNSTISVNNVDDLYKEVNDPANAGAAIVLAPGTYVLSATDTFGAPRPNGGRLDLQLDMSLQGDLGDRTQVVIDANRRDQFGRRLLPATSFGFKVGRTGIIRTGRGNSTIEWLTIAGNPLAAASISTDLVQTDGSGPMPTSLRVAHVSARDSARGVDVRNATVDTKGRRIVAEIEDSDFYFGAEGIRAANFVAADNGEITVDMQRNYLHGNLAGCVLENNRSNAASIVVRSYADQVYDNGLGCLIGGGFMNGSTGTANFNTTRFDAYGSFFMNNTRTVFNIEAGDPGISDRGGFAVSGGGVGPNGAPSTTSGDTAIVRLWDCQIAGNHLEGRQDFEFEAFGALCEAAACEADPPAGLAGTDNHALIQLRGLSALTEVVAVDSEPPDPDGTNTVTVVRIY